MFSSTFNLLKLILEQHFNLLDNPTWNFINISATNFLPYKYIMNWKSKLNN